MNIKYKKDEHHNIQNDKSENVVLDIEDDMDHTIDDYWKAIASIGEAQKNNRLAFFIGAGVSICSGAPSWSGLINVIKEKMKIEDSNSDYLKIAQLYYEFLKNKHNKNMDKVEKEYRETIRNEIFTKEFKPSDVHKLLMDIYPNNIITTNWDTLLEDSAEIEFKHYTTIKTNSEMLRSSQSHKIIKMHGDLDNDFVFKEDDYLNYSKNFMYIENYVKSVLTTHAVVFMGYSFNDINIKMISNWFNNTPAGKIDETKLNEWIAQQNGNIDCEKMQKMIQEYACKDDGEKPEWYMILVDDVSDEERAYLENKGFNVIELKKIFTEFARRNYHSITKNKSTKDTICIMKCIIDSICKKKTRLLSKKFDELFLTHVNMIQFFPDIDTNNNEEILNILYKKIKPLDFQNVILVSQLRKYVPVCFDEISLRNMTLDKWSIKKYIVINKENGLIESVYSKYNDNSETAYTDKEKRIIDQISKIFLKANLSFGDGKISINYSNIDFIKLINTKDRVKNKNIDNEYVKIKEFIFKEGHSLDLNEKIQKEFRRSLSSKYIDIFDILYDIKHNILNQIYEEIRNDFLHQKYQLYNLLSFIYYCDIGLNLIDLKNAIISLYISNIDSNFYDDSSYLKIIKLDIDIFIYLLDSEDLRKILFVIFSYSTPENYQYELDDASNTYFYKELYNDIFVLCDKNNDYYEKIKIASNYLFTSVFYRLDKKNYKMMKNIQKQAINFYFKISKQNDFKAIVKAEENNDYNHDIIEPAFMDLYTYILLAKLNHYPIFCETSIFITDKIFELLAHCYYKADSYIKYIISELSLYEYNNSCKIKQTNSYVIKLTNEDISLYIKNLITPLYKKSSDEVKTIMKDYVKEAIIKMSNSVIISKNDIDSIYDFYYKNNIKMDKSSFTYKSLQSKIMY